MSNTCVFRRCQNFYDRKNKDSGISYHTFPSDPLMKHKWVCVVQAERSEYDWMPKRCSKICSVHFKYEDKVIPLNGCTRLIKTAVPEIEELVINNEHMNNGNQDALENLHASDPSHFKSLWSQKTLARKIKEAFERHEREVDILNLHTHIDIKQEDLEDINSSVVISSSASCCQTNSACGSPTRESHIETFTEYEPQTTIDVTVKKEEPGSPISDVSLYPDAADSYEERELKNTLRKKMDMLNESEKALKRVHEDISILKKAHKKLFTDIKYLKNMCKKKSKLFELNEI